MYAPARPAGSRSPSDLRSSSTALHDGADLERMGDLAEHVAKIALRRFPVPAVPDELAPVIRDMAAVADGSRPRSARSSPTPDAIERRRQLERDDDEMDRLHAGLFEVLLGDDWRHGVEAAVDVTLLGRYYERFADHAVNAGHHMYFFVTGVPMR